ncbi:MAG: glycosyl transferase group 1 [Candidatus Berkelbacteria bacterium]|nr:glycosyl transferase group 1 [Candidatus Berkelbacteria bacterium]
MNIIIGTESFAPNISGVAIATEVLATNLAKSKNAVYVFAPSHPQANDRNYNFEVIRFKSRPNPFRKGFMIAKKPKKEVLKQVLRIKPDIIHLQDPTNICTGLLKASQKLKIPIVISNHFSLDYIVSYVNWLKPLHPFVKFGLRKYLARYYNCCEWVICPTGTVKKDLLTWGVMIPVEAISNGVDLERFYSYADLKNLYLKYHLPQNPIALYVGRIDQDKNLGILIRAIPRVLEKINAHFVIAGSGNDLERIKKLARNLKIDQQISFLGWIDHNSGDLPQLYQASEVFVIPSPHETQSIVVMEAMASGLPIVGARSGALPELIKNGQNGFLYDPSDSDDLAGKIIEIFKDKNSIKTMGRKSLEIVSSHQFQESIFKIRKIYEKVLARRQT